MDHLRSIAVFVLLLALLFQSALSQQETQQPLRSHVERLALIRLRSSLGLRAKDWPIKADPCLIWRGIDCRDGVVTGINISGFKRTRLGSQNPQFAVNALASLTQLESFNASFFALPGQIPDWFGHKMRNLHVLDLHSCSVVGAIPSSLGELLSLSVIDLSHNLLSGSIPPSIGNLANLQRLNFSGNKLSSSIPIQMGSLASLVELDLGSNHLGRILPLELNGMRNLRKMVLGNNELMGALPAGIFSALTQLEFVDLSQNYFEGKVPYYGQSRASLGANCLQHVSKQRTLAECASFYASRGLPFDNFGNPGATDPPRRTRKRTIILAAVLAAVALSILLSLVLLLLLCTCRCGSSPQLEDGRVDHIPDPIYGHLVEYFLTSRVWDEHLRARSFCCCSCLYRQAWPFMG
ncbi:hypothetical protein Nepgr_015285 [Nepenthes gracilis]|uniref:Leucine-rich repeat-containing N-terminal plant-type domain-containing protein n=1 Tax=Nepenthes gracilis TaxID=150966 RepID=A0AAD3SMK1_NEPGR|nr:hypothetical protein Nepgr_015285 [Nepenthes gracilis]